MDIDALHSALVSLTLLPEEVRSARENLLTSGGNGVALAQFLNGLERDLRITKAAVARDLGFRLCRCCWPPEIMTPDSNDKFVCAANLEEDPLSRVESVSLVPDEASNGGREDRRGGFVAAWRKQNPLKPHAAANRIAERPLMLAAQGAAQ